MEQNLPDFQQIYAEFQPRILRYVTGLVGEQEAEDLTQEIFVKVHRALAGFRGEAKPSTWVYRIATNTALDRLRNPDFRRTAYGSLNRQADASEAEITDMNPWTGEMAPPIEHQIFRKEMNDCIRGFVMKLPEDYRTVLLLGEFEGLKNNEIAEILGISLDLVKSRLHRARGRLKRELAGNCSPSWVEGNEFVPELRRAGTRK